MRLAASIIAGGLLAVMAAAPPARQPAPLSIDALRAAHFARSVREVRKLSDGPGFTASLVAYRSSALNVFALVATPTTPAPPSGFPVLIANHGTHPDPPRYGFTPAGVDSRPGDYYRPIPELFVRRGFLVVMPDYRGHNSSEGVEFARGFLASGYYTEDVLALLPGLRDIPHADVDNVFMWGHSLGGEVTLRALLATDRIRAASLWSSVGGDIWDQAYHYSRYKDREAPDGSGIEKARIQDLKKDIAALGAPYDWAAREPLRYLKFLRTPLVLHHSIGDTGAKYEWSERLAKELYMAGADYQFYTYAGGDHFFQGQVREQAVERDVEFFRGQMRPTAPPR